jgi:hypothetical protein
VYIINGNRKRDLLASEEVWCMNVCVYICVCVCIYIYICVCTILMGIKSVPCWLAEKFDINVCMCVYMHVYILDAVRACSHSMDIARSTLNNIYIYIYACGDCVCVCVCMCKSTLKNATKGTYIHICVCMVCTHVCMYVCVKLEISEVCIHDHANTINCQLRSIIQR